MKDTHINDRETDIPTGAIAYFVAYMFLMWFRDSIVGIPKAIANWFVIDPVKDNKIPMIDQPKQPLPETDEQVFESAFFRFIERVSGFFTKR